MKSVNTYISLITVLLLVLFLISGCSEKISAPKTIGSSEESQLTEYIKYSKEFYENYYTIAEEADKKSEDLEMFLKKVAEQEDKFVKMKELLGIIKEVTPEDKSKYYERMVKRCSRLKKLYNYSKKDFKSLTSKEKREISRERTFMITYLDRWKNYEEYAYLFW